MAEKRPLSLMEVLTAHAESLRGPPKHSSEEIRSEPDLFRTPTRLPSGESLAEHPLAMAQRQVHDGMRRIRKQRRLIARLKHAKQSTRLAVELLHAMEELQEIHVDRLARLCAGP